ncbi:MAG: hypothetical protein M1833_002665 [Piccolia ochrophora]|nr:MAG: hypothetical protein M1833_002665 [Piccolia ochrophora]
MPSRYSAVHSLDKLKGPGDARPTALDIVKDEGLEGKLADKVFLVTGTSSGIGIETARALAATGAKLFLTVRNLDKGKEALSSVLATGQVELLEMDNASLASVRSAAEKFLSKSKTLNILIANAGVMAIENLTKTVDGFETQFGTNYVSHFLLFQLLKDTLISSATPEFPSRVVAVSSSGHRVGGIQFGNYDFENGGYSPWGAYGQSKTAGIYMANEIERRYGALGLHGLSLHPGGIITGLQKHISNEVKESWDKDEKLAIYMKNAAQGASTTVYAALSQDWKGRGGRFLEDCDESPPVDVGNSDLVSVGYAPHAYDEAAEKRLWKESLVLLDLGDDDGA